MQSESDKIPRKKKASSSQSSSGSHRTMRERSSEVLPHGLSKSRQDMPSPAIGIDTRNEFQEATNLQQEEESLLSPAIGIDTRNEFQEATNLQQEEESLLSPAIGIDTRNEFQEATNLQQEEESLQLPSQKRKLGPVWRRSITSGKKNKKDKKKEDKNDLEDKSLSRLAHCQFWGRGMHLLSPNHSSVATKV
jgi:hypothetical protein